MQNKVLYICLVCMSVLIACAQIVNPTGGRKDEENPIVVQSEPINESVNFDADAIILNFNEFIELKHPEKVIISPPLKEKLSIDYRRKQIIVSLKNQKLDSSITYSINLSGSITDIHEGLPLKNFTYSFSKGDHIDKDSIYGTVVDAFTTKPRKEFTVALYDTTGFNDSIPFNTKPSFYCISNDSGYFEIKNLPKKLFWVFCFNDANKNIRFDNNEEYGFIDKPLSSTTSISQRLRINKSDLFPKNKKLDAFKIGSNSYAFVIYQPEKINVAHIGKDLGKTSNVYKEGVQQFDTIFFTSENQTPDSSVDFVIKVERLKSDTVSLNNYKKVKNRKPFINTQTLIKVEDTVKIILNHPCLFLDTNRIKILLDSTEIKYKTINSSALIKHLLFKKEEGKLYKITFKDSSLLSVDGEYNANKIIEVKTYSSNQTGEIKLNIINNKQVPSIISLVSNNEKEEELFSILNNRNQENTIKYCNPGEYKIKVVIDTNKNGKWDKGNWFTKMNPEPIYYLNEVIAVRVLWEIEQSISIDNILK